MEATLANVRWVALYFDEVCAELCLHSVTGCLDYARVHLFVCTVYAVTFQSGNVFVLC